MSKEELLKPRIKILHDWPGVAGEVIPGTIINVDDEFENDMFWIGGDPFLLDKIRDYPYLFKELEWWEEREEKDMPEYVSYKFMQDSKAKIIKVYKHFFSSFGEVNHRGFLEDKENFCAYSKSIPATKEEYENQIKKQG